MPGSLVIPTTRLGLDHVSEHEKVPIVPDSFLGGSAPRLRYLYLVSHSFVGNTSTSVSAARWHEEPLPIR
jgi:hypothetical protein